MTVGRTWIPDAKRYEPSAARLTFCDYYFMALGVLLAGYAIGSKTFAYISIGPVYIGDVVLAFGIIAFLKSRCAVATLATLPSLLLGVLLGWAIARTLPYLAEFGIDALRDSVIFTYGGFAFIVAALLLERPERLPLVIPFLRVVGSAVILAAPILQMARFTGYGPEAQYIVGFHPADAVGCHLVGAALLMLLGFRRASIGWLILMLIGMFIVSIAARTCLVVIVISVTFAAIVAGRLREFGIVVVTIASLIGLAYALDLSVGVKPVLVNRDLSARQLVENVLSTFGATDVKFELQETRDFRLLWWKTIINYTFEGPYFWTGKGFGVNLALTDGFVVNDEDPTQPLLRIPHNAHMNILARTGVPGLTLWLLTFGTWSTMLLVNMVRARMRSDNSWADFFVLIFCYELAIFIAGTFATGLEAPMLGIWFWSLFGVGIGATMIYRASLRGIEQKGIWHANAQVVGST